MSRNKFNPKLLHDLWGEEIDILSEVDKFCSEHNLSYSLAYGSMIGAVRHKGFIPWDDDMDVFMTRKDYDKFIQEWQKNPQKGFVIQNNDIEPSFKQSFTKVHKNNTIFLTEEAIGQPYHHGIRIDIFPIDKIPNGKFARIKQRVDALLSMLYTREYVTKANGKLLYYGGGLILKCTPNKFKEKLKRYFLRQQTKYNYDGKDYSHYCCFDVISDFNKIYKKEWIENIEYKDFEGHKFSCFANTHEMLSLIYGDYMKYPPKEQQVWTHHPIAISFDECYPSDRRFLE